MSRRATAVAVLAGRYPLLSETFVYREVRALRARGWRVRPIALHPPEPGQRSHVADRPVLTLYGPRRRAHLLAGMREAVRRPIRTARTLTAAWRDAVWPGEPTGLRQRATLIGQACYAIALAARLRRMGIVHLHCHFAHAPATVGMYAARQLGIPFSFVGHANDLFERRVLLKRKLTRAAFVSCISQWHRDYYRDVAASVDGKCRIIRCGVEVNGTSNGTVNGSANGSATAGRWGGHVVTVCRLVPKKGTDTLLRALASLLDDVDGPAWSLTVIGDGPERDALRRLADDLGCASAVRWCGSLPNDEVRAQLDEADAFALPCRVDGHNDRDGIPVVLMEAMAAGVPVVAGDLPAIRELVAHEQTGLLVEASNVGAVARSLRRLRDDAGLRQRLASAGRRRVAEEFSLTCNVERLELALRETSDRTTLAVVR
ncbi:MAG: glycosyltransferase family 4 protein [Phycisphaeraceae bacterium]